MKKMWKGLLAVFASLLLFAAPALVNATEAPRNKLVGVWMLIYEGNTYYKQITKDGRFINLAPDTETGVFYVSRQGTYELKGKNHYVETITHEWGEAIQPDKTDIVYTVKKGKLTLDFEKYGQQMHEEWTEATMMPDYKTHR